MPILNRVISLPNFWSILCMCFLEDRKLSHSAKLVLIILYYQIKFSLLHRFSSQLFLKFWRFYTIDQRIIFEKLDQFCRNQDSRDVWIHQSDIYFYYQQEKVSISNFWSKYLSVILMKDWGILKVISHAEPSFANFILVQL